EDSRSSLRDGPQIDRVAFLDWHDERPHDGAAGKGRAGSERPHYGHATIESQSISFAMMTSGGRDAFFFVTRYDTPDRSSRRREFRSVIDEVSDEVPGAVRDSDRHFLGNLRTCAGRVTNLLEEPLQAVRRDRDRVPGVGNRRGHSRNA